MGGIGSGAGRRYWSKDTTSSYFGLDIRYLHRRGLLEQGRSGNVQWSRSGEPVGKIEVRFEEDDVWLSYTHSRGGEEPQSYNYPVSVTWTLCNYGGSRPWFRCLAAGCGRRVAILYGGGIFACRYCYGLNCDTQHEQAWDRALTSYQKIRVKLGGHSAIGPFPDKPKGMHWRAYERWRMKASQAESCSWPKWIYRMVEEQWRRHVGVCSRRRRTRLGGDYSFGW